MILTFIVKNLEIVKLNNKNDEILPYVSLDDKKVYE